MWVVFALAALLLFGFKNFFEKVSSKKGDIEVIMIIERVVALIIISLSFVFYLLRTEESILVFNKGVLMAFLAAVFMAGGTLFLYRSLKKHSLAIVSPVTSLAPLVPAILGIIILKEEINSYWIIGLFFAVAAFLFFTYKSRKFKISGLPFLAMGAFGLMSFANKMAVGSISPFFATFLVFSFAMVFYVAFFILKSRKKKLKIEKGAIIKSVSAGICLGLGSVFFFTALSLGPISRISFMVDLNIVLTVSLALFFLKERLDSQRYAGIIFAIASMILLSLS